MIQAARWLAAGVLALGVLLGATGAVAHPLPNSLIVVKPGFGGVRLAIDTPAPDLAIAMRADAPAESDVNNPDAVARYYGRHVVLKDTAGRRLPLTVASAALIDATDPDVGRYREWRVVMSADTPRGGNYTLAYDAVIHQIPNHFALVRIEPTQSTNEVPQAPRDVGVIRYDFASASIAPLTINLTTGGIASGFAAMISVGFFHVLSGLDHILFLVALLMAAPFDAHEGRWRFQGMDRRAMGRFAAISGAFTLGHSISLAAGTFGFDAIPVRLTETLVAASILIAAVHALRPLFPRREWLVAGGFGLIHGLAFSETLAAMELGMRAKVGALLGFNLGVELAQVTGMAAALPILALGGSQKLEKPRQAVLILIAVIAALWVGQRAWSMGLPPR